MTTLRKTFPNHYTARLALTHLRSKLKLEDYRLASRETVEQYFSKYQYRIFKEGLKKVMLKSWLYSFFSIFIFLSAEEFSDAVNFKNFIDRVPEYMLFSISFAVVPFLIFTIGYILSKKDSAEIHHYDIDKNEVVLVFKVDDEDVNKAKELIEDVYEI